MYRRFDRYLITESSWLFLGFLALACSILLIERLVRLTEIVSGSENPAFDAVRLISRLLPHYIELALPGALLLTTILTINRLSRNGELTAMIFSGVSLYRLVRPFVMVSLILATLSILSSGYLKPLSRYSFRAVVFEIGQNNITTAFQDRKFIQYDNWTVWTGGTDTGDDGLGETFIFETAENGREQFMLGGSGELRRSQDGKWVITLRDAMIGDLPDITENTTATHATVKQIDWEMSVGSGPFRIRGLDERELTLTELFSKSYEESTHDVDPIIATADLHDRVVRAAMLVSLTFVGFVLGLNLQRRQRTGGLVIGILVLLSIQKLLEFGLLKAQQGVIPAWAGAWPLFFAVTLIALVLFHRANGNRLRLQRRHALEGANLVKAEGA
ncbi:LptF/LptG family permease [Roseovarius rhodophyticola]|uniref:LptF/LptG family permease n=1 Tax=Roseovarius rhodophyticola TaxID=3080827 RepID=A0ABZ2TDV4_9RHOB|nr:LptF/LptG family permease [Roseovarius sp. W115]MDV2931022.1 LptF/LptG family permease [Roseovarius sp. W115]